ncbi:MAG: HAD-IA family hydrolase [Candidatus Bathyarchaeia archaeon]
MTFYKDKLRALRSVDALSLDVFDTAVHRYYIKPEDLFLKIRNDLVHSDMAVKYPEWVRHFPIYRKLAEDIARKQNFASRGTWEVSLKDIYLQMQEMFNIDPKDLREVMTQEIVEEIKSAYADPFILKIFQLGRRLGKQIVFCSDMYLPKDAIRKILARNGFDGEYSVFVSGELGKSKHEATIYKEVAQSLGLSPSRILHIGDNPSADGQNARKSGLRVWLYRAPNNVRRKWTWLEQMAARGGYTDQLCASVIGGLIDRHRAVHSTDNQLQEIGYEYFGPILTGFMLFLLGSVYRNNPDKIILVARDTYPIWQALQRLASRLELQVPYEYVYLSRAALLLPSFTEASDRKLWFLLMGRSAGSAQTRLEELGIPKHVIAAIAQQCGIDLQRVRPSDNRIYAFLSREFKLLFERAVESRELVKEYVKQVIGAARKITLVDLGWNGNIQACLSRLINPYEVSIHGVYLGLFTVPEDSLFMGHSMRGWVVQGRQPRDWYEVLINGGLGLLELAFCGPHGSTLGYKKVEGKIEPILEDDDEHELRNREIALQIQTGALRFLEEAFEALSVTMPKAETLGSTTIWAEPFKRLVQAPTREQVRLFIHFTHSDVAGHNKRRYPLVPQLTFWQRCNPIRYRKTYQEAFWKAGFATLNKLFPWL